MSELKVYCSELKSKYDRVCDENQKLRSYFQHQQATFENKTKQYQQQHNKLNTIAHLMKNIFVFYVGREPTQEDFLDAVQRQQSQKARSSSAIAPAQQRPNGQMNLYQVNGGQMTVPTSTLRSTPSAHHQYAQMIKPAPNNPLAFVQSQTQIQAYQTPFAVCNPGSTNTSHSVTSNGSSTRTGEVIDLTGDEFVKAAPQTPMTATTTLLVTPPASGGSSSRPLSREYYVAAVGPNLGGPSKVPAWTIQAKAEMQAQARMKAVRQQPAAPIPSAGSMQNKRKHESEQLPSKKAKTQQTKKTAEHVPKGPKKTIVKKPRAPRKPKTSTRDTEEIAQAAPAEVDREREQMENDEFVAGWEAELGVLAEQDAQVEQYAKWEADLADMLTTEIGSMNESEEICSDPAHFPDDGTFDDGMMNLGTFDDGEFNQEIDELFDEAGVGYGA